MMTVVTGARIASVEAMEMEHVVTAPHAGVVRLLAATGEQLQRDDLLAEVIEEDRR